MKVLALTGTPGTGKTTIANELNRLGWESIEFRALIEEHGLGGEHDPERDTREVDLEALAQVVAKRLNTLNGPKVVIEGHLAHELGLANRVVVLRCHPKVLARRLGEREYLRDKVAENCEAEALDVILVETLEANEQEGHELGEAGKATEKVIVAELDTTELQPAAAAKVIEAWVEGNTPEAIKPPGTARWLPEYLEVE